MYEKFAKNELKNNLFEYATSELSQDAFICWLASYAHEEAEKDAALNECARKMLEMFVPEFEGKNFKLLNVERQVDNVDVLLTVECEENIYKIIVEDKTYTSEHDNQLNRYVEELAKKHEENTVIVKGVYYKTGFQSDLSSVKEAHYEIISREKMLNLMQQYVDKTNNQIFISYYNYWNSKQKLVETFETLPVVDWGWWAVYGFYDYLHTKTKSDKFLDNHGFKSNYSYVSNVAGGFECFHMPLKDANKELFIVDQIDKDGKVIKHKCWLYLQIETIIGAEKTNMEIRLKVANDNENNTRVNTYDLKNKFLTKYVYGNTKFVKPASLRTGKWMTVGIYDVKFGENDGVEVLMKLLEDAISDYKMILEKYNAENSFLTKED